MHDRENNESLSSTVDAAGSGNNTPAVSRTGSSEGSSLLESGSLDDAHTPVNTNGVSKNGVHKAAPVTEKTVSPEHNKYTAVAQDEAAKELDRKPNSPVDEFDGEDLRCGYGKCRPQALQCCNNPKFVVFWLSWFAFVQGFVVNGIINVNMTSMERLYNLGTSQAGFIASSYDLSAGFLVIPLTYFGTYGHQPRMLSLAALVMALGSFTMAMPHFVTGPYVLGETVAGVCDLSGTEEVCEGNSNMSNYLYVFVLGQLLHGFGGCILYTLGVVYIDSNVKTKNSALYQSIMTAAMGLGPAVGFVLGGSCLDIYVDFNVLDADKIEIGPDDPRWVGAWWIGYLIASCTFATIVIGMYPYPKITPAGLKTLRGRVSEAHQDGAEEVCSKAGFFTTWRDIPIALKMLVCNPVLIFAALAKATESMLLTGYSTFVPKLIMNQFGQSAARSSLLTGFVVVPGIVAGNLLGGLVTKKMDLKVRGMLRLCIGLCLLCVGASFFALIRCDDANLAGVAVPYGETESVGVAESVNISATCNSACGCTAYTYEPVCGSDGVQYFTACHAGCMSSNFSTDGLTEYFNCSCVTPAVNETIGSAVEGLCELPCNSMPAFLFLLFVVVMLTFGVYTPNTNVALRCIPQNQRAFGLGVTEVFRRFMGTLPGPLLFGYIFDKSCLVWQDDCNEQGSCWVYDNTNLSIGLLSITVVIKSLSAIFFIGAIFCYKPPKDESKDAELQDEEKEVHSNGHLAATPKEIEMQNLTASVDSPDVAAV